MICPYYPDPSYLIFSTKVPVLLYYSHIPVLIIALIIGLFVYSKNRQSLLSKILLAISVFFSLWVFCDLITWTTNTSSVSMFFWSFFGLFFILINVLCVYFAYVYVYKKDLAFKYKLLLSIPIFGSIFITPTSFNLAGFDLVLCGVGDMEGKYYTSAFHIVGLLSFLTILYLILKKYKKVKTEERKGLLPFSVGIGFFLLSFFVTSYLSSILIWLDLTTDFSTGMYGLFGMIVFMAFLAYLIVRYEAFNIKLIGTTVLLFSQGIILASLLFIQDINYIYALIAASLILFLILSMLTVRGVKREIEAKEALKVSNEGQESLIHIMNHQIKGYLGKARDIFAELLESNDYGEMPKESKGMLAKGLENTAAGVDYVQGILKGASAHNGTLSYTTEPVDVKAIVSSLLSSQKDAAEKNGLSFGFSVADGNYNIAGDATQLGEAFKNLITNAIKYNNLNGSIKVDLKNKDGKILFSVKDTGHGISDEDRSRLFTAGGMGKDSMKYNVESSGFGLAFVKGVVEHHKGTVEYKSNSPEKGTTFFVELPIK